MLYQGSIHYPVGKLVLMYLIAMEFKIQNNRYSENWKHFEQFFKMLSIFGVYIVLYFIKILSGSRNLWNLNWADSDHVCDCV
jgi:hypothetical protein